MAKSRASTPLVPSTTTPVSDQTRARAVVPVFNSEPIKVRATRMGYYDHLRRREGDIFVVAASAFASEWMEEVDPRTRERITTAGQALAQRHSEILGGEVTGASLPPGSTDVFGPS